MCKRYITTPRYPLKHTGLSNLPADLLVNIGGCIVRIGAYALFAVTTKLRKSDVAIMTSPGSAQ